ncbi:MAG: 23S rRNA (guanosine(2251)-2'-O)-methyltransferase RlmB [Saprospiraceae bacterium]|nr:23S rRNA (guanosine(2251)-2'-O)-methyltransferase RlmB [Saprospiraceae bacterium]
MIYGRHPIEDALKEGKSFEKIIILQSIRGEFEKRIRQYCKELNIPLQTAPKERLNKITRKNHQGIIGFVAIVAYQSLEDVVGMMYDQGMPLFIVLDGVTDVRNMGAIARSAEASGANALIIPKKGNAQINEEAVKTSAGALNTLPVCRVNSLVTTVEYLQMNGIQVVAADLDGGQFLYEVDMTAPLAIVVGAEDKGVSKEVLKRVDIRFKIPMNGKTDSFNVSVATGITLYETLRQRKDHLA